MKYKKLVIILSSIIGAILLLLLLTFTLFRVNSVSIDFKNETTIFASDEFKNEIIYTSNAQNYSTIFAVKKSEIKNNLEHEYPYLKVINIETVFPNSLVIHCAEREETFTIKISDNLYYICDEDLKILSVATNYEAKNGTPALLNNVEIKNKTARVGEFLDMENAEIVKDMITAFAYNNKTISDFKNMFKNVSLNIERDYYTRQQEVSFVFNTYDDFSVKLGLAKSFLVEKVSLMLNLIPKSIDKYKTHQLVIEINPDNVSDTYIRYEKLS